MRIRVTLDVAAAAVVILLSMVIPGNIAIAQTVYTVTTVGDGGDNNPGDGVCNDGTGDCTLRAAIEEANALVGTDTIKFNIPGPAPHTFQPASIYSIITDPVVIDASTEPDYSGNPVIELDGSLIPGVNFAAFRITGGSSTIRGFVINRWSYIGIWLQTMGNNVIEGNYIGTDVTGTINLGNGDIGVVISGSDSNMIGGVALSARNIISGNWQGVVIFGSTTQFNKIQGNFIGTDVTGTVAFGNVRGGVEIKGSFNTVGGSAEGAGNLISGNDFQQILVFGNGATGNLISGNYIGTDVTGSTALLTVGISHGIFIRASSGNTIGGSILGAKNLISGNPGFGILFSLDADSNLVQGNFIGTDANCINALPNNVGVVIGNGSSFNTIGGTGPIFGNVISGNSFWGIKLGDFGTEWNVIRGNRIGTDQWGLMDIGNSQGGVFCFGPSSNNTFGGLAPDEGNIIAFNQGHGIMIGSFNQPSGNEILSNSIFSNSGLGIDLGDDGVTANDPGDADTGPNKLQNFPEISSAVINGNGDLVIEYIVNSDTINSSYPLSIQFFESDTSGQGKTLLGSDSYTIPEFISGVKVVNLGDETGLGVVNDELIVATSTDDSDNTSEFSSMVIVSIVPRTIVEPDTMYGAQLNSILPIPASVYIGNLVGSPSVQDINLSSILINGAISPTSSSIITSHPAFIGDVLEITFPIRAFLLTYGILWDVTVQDYTVTGVYNDASAFDFTGKITLVGHRSGDINLDGFVNIADLSYLIDYIFRGGPKPTVMLLADVNGSCGPANVIDLTYFVDFIFRGGPAPVQGCSAP